MWALVIFTTAMNHLIDICKIMIDFEEKWLYSQEPRIHFWKFFCPVFNMIFCQHPLHVEINVNVCILCQDDLTFNGLILFFVFLEGTLWEQKPWIMLYIFFFKPLKQKKNRYFNNFLFIIFLEHRVYASVI